MNRFLALWVLLSLYLYVTGCSEKQKSWEIIDARLETELEIGNDSLAFLSDPSFIVVDSDKNIIVADRGQSKLLVFNSSGQFLHEIGERGPGPDEFRDITGMSINDKDEIMVLDRSSQALKVFSVSGEYLKSYKLPSPVTTKVKFHFWENLQFLFFVRPNLDLDQNHLLHIYSKDFDAVVNEAIQFQSLDDFREMDIPLLMGSVGSTLLLENRLLFSPAVYNGYIYEYTLSLSDSPVHYRDKISGYTHKEPVSIVSRSQSNNSEYADITVSNPEITMRMLLYNKSKGLYKLKDGNIIHFTYVEDEKGEKRTFGFELYDQTLQSLGYASLHVKPFLKDPEANNLFGWYILAKDKDDRFYVVDITQDIPIIKVMRLDYQISTKSNKGPGSTDS